MSKKLFLFGTIASVIAINSVFADTIVTSKSYVDTTRQATIPVAGTNEDEPGETVVTYTGTAGQIGERGICNNEEDDDCAPNDLVTVRELDSAVSNNMPIYSVNAGPGRVVVYGDIPNSFDARGIYDGSTTYDSSTDADKLVTASVVQNATNNLPETASTNKVCVGWEEGKENAGDDYCILWNLVDTLVYGFPACEIDADCNDFARSCPMRMATCVGWPSHCECGDGTLG